MLELIDCQNNERSHWTAVIFFFTQTKGHLDKKKWDSLMNGTIIFYQNDLPNYLITDISINRETYKVFFSYILCIEI